MSDDRPITDLAHGVPPIAATTTSTLGNRTGSWKYIRPVYQDKVAPCNAGCPVGIDIEGVMNLLRLDKVNEARELLLRENPLPSTCGRVCGRPCETVCNRGFYDEAVGIHAVERMLGDAALEAPLPPKAERTRKETAAVVGSGPAGLACAYHLARLGYGVRVFEADTEPGGALRTGIPEYRLPRQVLAREIDRIRALGVEFVCGSRLGGDFTLIELSSYDAVFVATGAPRSRALGVPDEDLESVMPAARFLRRVNAGEKWDLGRRVVVVGGDHSAIDSARVALRLGSDVQVLWKGSRAEMPALPGEVEAAEQEGVRFAWNTVPVGMHGFELMEDEIAQGLSQSILAEDGSPPPQRRVSGVECVRVRPAAGGNGATEELPGTRCLVPADSVISATGEDPELDVLPAELQRDANGLVVDDLGRTSRADYFAGGDVVTERRSVALALGAGKRAALGIDHMLRTRAGEALELDVTALRYAGTGNVSMTRWRKDDPVFRRNEANETVTKEQINYAHFRTISRAQDRELDVAVRRRSFAEANLGLTAAEGMGEARRCFNCGVCIECDMCLIFCPDVAITRREGGRYSISYKYCKGCGVCCVECPRGGMAMTREGL